MNLFERLMLDIALFIAVFFLILIGIAGFISFIKAVILDE